MLFKREKDFQVVVCSALTHAGFYAYRERCAVMLGSVSFVDVVIELPDGSPAYAVECKIYPDQSELQRALGQCMTHSLLEGVTSVLCLPSDFEVDADLFVLCESHGILVCTETSVVEIIKAHSKNSELWNKSARIVHILRNLS